MNINIIINYKMNALYSLCKTKFMHQNIVTENIINRKICNLEMILHYNTNRKC